MAQPPTDHNFYHPQHPHANMHVPQLQLTTQFRNPFEMLFDERMGTINYNYIRPYMPKPGIEYGAYGEDYYDPLVIRRPRRSRTTFTSSQIAELEQYFEQGRYLTAGRLAELSSKLHLGTAQVKIWFKNRRRRCKILSELRNSENCDAKSSLSLSSQKNKAATSNSSIQQQIKIENMPLPNLNLLTPSPTPTTNGVSLTPTAAVSVAVTQTTQNFQTADAYNQNYYHYQRGTLAHAHSHINHHIQAQQQNSQNFPQTNQAQTYARNNLLANSQLSQLQPLTLPLQSSYYGSNLKQTPLSTDYNFNNAYCFNKSIDSAPPAADTTALSDRSSATTDLYEPLTPKNEENGSQCTELNNGGDLATDNVNKTFHTLEPKKMFEGQRFGMNNTGGFYNTADEKVSNQHMSSTELNYHCTMDTLMHAYNNHRHSNDNTNISTYCFN